MKIFQNSKKYHVENFPSRNFTNFSSESWYCGVGNGKSSLKFQIYMRVVSAQLKHCRTFGVSQQLTSTTKEPNTKRTLNISIVQLWDICCGENIRERKSHKDSTQATSIQHQVRHVWNVESVRSIFNFSLSFTLYFSFYPHRRFMFCNLTLNGRQSDLKTILVMK